MTDDEDQAGDEQVARHDFDEAWLEIGEPNAAYTKFSHYPLKERPGSRARVRDALSEALVDHHAHRRRVATRLSSLGYEEAAQYFREELPQADRTRKGNFGEVVATEHLIQRFGYSVPVFKLRFRDSVNMPSRGEDIVAFVVAPDGEIARVIVGEAKVLSQFRSATVREAHERLETAWNPRPMTLSLIAEILYNQNQDELADAVDRVGDALAQASFPRENWVFLICKRIAGDAFQTIEDSDAVVADLCCAELELPDLGDFIHDLYDSPALGTGGVDDAGA